VTALDRAAAAEMPARYAHAVDNDDLAALEDCFTPDAVLHVEVRAAGRSKVHEGRPAILELFRESFKTHRTRRHVVSSVVVSSLSGDSARVRSYITVLGIDGDVIRPSASGVYEDLVIPGDGGWRIKERHGLFDTATVLSSTFFRD
jgi:uncharacterized protein (TIGR02246 family)